MATNKVLRTPIIKPRNTGGTFYTFSSAAEDIGLNIAEQKNKVSLSHYVLLNLPEITPVSGTTSAYPSGHIGDYTLAENFENYVLNMETVLRNQNNYNFSANMTVSERVFWKWISEKTTFVEDEYDSNYYVEEGSLETPSIAKAFGLISSSAQRSDEYGLYNETFVQIPTSYGKMKVLFEPYKDENYTIKPSGYSATNTSGYIENITTDEIDSSGNIIATGISAKGIYDSSAAGFGVYSADASTDVLRVVLDMDALKEYYEDETLTIDDIGMGNVEKGLEDSDSFEFNAILVYYSIYDSAANKILATNAYGVLILNSAGNSMTIPTLEKIRSSATSSGTSYAFRLNIKTTSTYTGTATINDNSTATYSMSEDFNDAIKNMNTAIDVLKSNAATLANIVTDNSTIKALAMDAIDKCETLNTTVSAIRQSGEYDSINVGTAYIKADSYHATDDTCTEELDASVVDELLGGISVNTDEDGAVTIKVDPDQYTSTEAQAIADNLVITKGGLTYNNTMMLMSLLFAKVAQLAEEIEN